MVHHSAISIVILVRSLCLSLTPQPESIMGGAVVDDSPPGVKAPDGGWGWAVLAGCFVITGFSYAFPKAVSVFFKELMREFDVGYSDTAWISSILLAMLYGTGRSPPPEHHLLLQGWKLCLSLRSLVQRAGQQVWLSTSDDGWRVVCLAGDDCSLVCHQHHAHLPERRSYYRYTLNIEGNILLLSSVWNDSASWK